MSEDKQEINEAKLDLIEVDGAYMSREHAMELLIQEVRNEAIRQQQVQNIRQNFRNEIRSNAWTQWFRESQDAEERCKLESGSDRNKKSKYK